MPRPRLSSQMTTTEVARQLDMNEERLVNWIKHKVLPPPSFIDNNGVRYFDKEWLGKARRIVKIKCANPARR